MMTVNLAGNRQLAHAKIQDLMKRGELDEAHYQAEEALSQFGPHLSLLCDKASCEFEIGYFTDCENTFRIIETEFLKAERLASVDSKRRTSLFLATVAEELGEYNKTLKFLSLAKTLSCSDEDLNKIFMHELRVHSYLNYNQGLSAMYNLIQNKTAAAETQSVDCLRSLMWAEWKLFGFEHAEMRFRQWMSKKLTASDSLTVSRDFIEISILSKQLQTEAAQFAVQNLRTEDISAFDDALLYITMGLPVRAGLQADVGVSKLMQLRILKLAARHEKNPQILSDLRQQYYTIVSTLSEASRTLLMAFV